MARVSADMREQACSIQSLKNHCVETLLQKLSFFVWGELLCRRIETANPSVKVCLSYLVEQRPKHWAAPSMPVQYGKTIDHWEADDSAPCYSLAAYQGEPVLTEDITTDALWDSCKSVLSPLGSQSCWSYPIKGNDGVVLGTMAFYFAHSDRLLSCLKLIAKAIRPFCLLAMERENEHAQVIRLTHFDVLTNVFNRSHMDCLLNDLLRGDFGKGLSLTVLDLDRLKDVNNAMGHDSGDQVLLAIATRLQRQLLPEQHLGRFGSDQFIVASIDQDVDAAMQAAAHMLDVVSEPMEINGYTLYLSASIGVSHCTQEARKTRSELLSMAKAALLRGKENGGSAYNLFAPPMTTVSEERLAKIAELKQAITENRLRLHYQPQICSGSGELYGIEALARWNSNTFGEVPPSTFISLAEETGQIDALGFWVLREACRQLSEWRSQGLNIPVISVNLSPINFQNPGLPTILADLLEEFELRGNNLTIEITESTMLKLTPDMLTIVQDIRALGMGLSVDDFGTGYASLSNLIDLPLSEIKIDRSFVEASPLKPRQKALVETVIGIGRSLGLTVVAEGVETSAQYGLLTDYHCPVLQGYFFARPLDAESIPNWLLNHQQRWDDHQAYL